MTGHGIPDNFCYSAEVAAEAKDCTPVAGDSSNGPTNWFELSAQLCHEGLITETRFRRAVAAVSRGVSRE